MPCQSPAQTQARARLIHLSVARTQQQTRRVVAFDVSPNRYINAFGPTAVFVLAERVLEHAGQRVRAVFRRVEVRTIDFAVV